MPRVLMKIQVFLCVSEVDARIRGAMCGSRTVPKCSVVIDDQTSLSGVGRNTSRHGSKGPLGRGTNRCAVLHHPLCRAVVRARSLRTFSVILAFLLLLHLSIGEATRCPILQCTLGTNAERDGAAWCSLVPPDFRLLVFFSVCHELPQCASRHARPSPHLLVQRLSHRRHSQSCHRTPPTDSFFASGPPLFAARLLVTMAATHRHHVGSKVIGCVLCVCPRRVRMSAVHRGAEGRPAGHDGRIIWTPADGPVWHDRCTAAVEKVCMLGVGSSRLRPGDVLHRFKNVGDLLVAGPLAELVWVNGD